jgi:hypothetical protein
MFDISALAILIAALPLAATLATAALGPRMLRGRSHVPVITALALAFVASVVLLVKVDRQSQQAAAAGRHRGYELIVTLWTWAAVPGAYEDSGFGVQGSGFGVQGSGFGVQGSGFGVRGSGFGVEVTTLLTSEH